MAATDDSLWRGRTVLITGASRGIGRAVARHLDRRGARLVLVARGLEGLEALLAELSPEAGHAVAALDVRDEAAVDAGFERALAPIGRLDALVANAGVGVVGPVSDVTEEELSLVIDTNLSGVIRCVRAALPWLRRAEPPRRIVLVSSASGRRGDPGLGVYSATKAALFALADAMRLELREGEITTSVVAPGPTADTGFREAAAGGERLAPLPAGATPASRVAEVVGRALEEGRPAYDLKRWGRLRAALNTLLPGLYDRYLSR